MHFLKQALRQLSLKEISYWEVQSIEKTLLPQLSPLNPARFAMSVFCNVYLKRTGASKPPRIFGLIASCYPDSAEHVGQIDTIELLFPRANESPRLVTIHGVELDPDYGIETYLTRVPILGSRDDWYEFSDYSIKLDEEGFILEQIRAIEDLEHAGYDRDPLAEPPWISVVTSRWLSDLSEEARPDVLSKLSLLLKQHQLIINYAPDQQFHRMSGAHYASSVEEMIMGMGRGVEKIFGLSEGKVDRDGESAIQTEHTKDESAVLKKSLDVFLCHSSRDKLIVKKLFSKLKAERGIDPWMDEEKLLPGEHWDIEIRKAVRESDVVIVVLSTSSINKEGYIQKELRFALDVANEKPEGTIFIVPLKIEECEVPDSLSHWQWLNYYEKGAYEKLLLSLKKRAQTLGISTS